MNKNIHNLYSEIYRHNTNKEKDKVNENLKTLINTPVKNISLDKKHFNSPKDLGYKLKPLERKNISIKREKLIDSTFEIFFRYNTPFKDSEIKELKNELYSMPIEDTFPLIYIIDNLYLDMVVYHILNFIKDTKHILDNINTKTRYYHSRFQIDVLKKRLKDLENIKQNYFLMPKTEYDIELLNSKNNLLKAFNNNYSIIFAFAHLYSINPMQNIFKNPIFNEAFKDFIDFVNCISTTNKDAIKSLAILIFKLFEKQFNHNDLEVSIQNILRIFFENEIIEFNQNKSNYEHPYDTFLIDSKSYTKNPYIHSSFDNIPIYGINKENKYFFYKDINIKQFMKAYFYSAPFDIKDISFSYYKQIKKQFNNPQINSFMKQYPEFFENQNYNTMDIMTTFFSEMKKTAPDELK